MFCSVFVFLVEFLWNLSIIHELAKCHKCCIRIHLNYREEGRKERRRKEGRKEGRKEEGREEGRKEGRKEGKEGAGGGGVTHINVTTHAR